jgi:hypothetical protein
MLNIGQIFTAESQNVYDFLTIEGQGCYVPAYQRGYAWDSQNVGRLLEDATLGLERLVVDETSVRFLGSIIAVQGNALVAAPPPLDRELPRRVLTIIDGQQRLCTIVVLNILLHDRVSKLVETLSASENAGVTAVCADARDFLDDLIKTYQFEGRRAAGLNRIYPRIIRSMDDQWARSPDHARYTSPIARFIWAYIAYTNRPADDDEAAGGFEYDGTDDDGATLPGHEALVGVIEFLRSELESLASGNHSTLVVPDLADIVAEGSKITAELWPHQLPESVRAYIADEEEDDDYLDIARTMRLLALARFVNFRMAATIIDANEEDYAFDMFEALNTTGQPLTAFETFKPKVIEAEGVAEYARSPSRGYVDTVQGYLDRFKKAEERQGATSTLLVPFALAENGHKLEKHLSHQRRYLRDQFANVGGRAAKRAFVRNLATTATFVGAAWRPPRNRTPRLLPDPARTDAVAEFCFEALRDLRHDITLAPLTRFYAAYEAADPAHKEAAAANFFAAVKAMTAFSMLWRASKGGTANIDGAYREILGRGIAGVPPLCRRPAGGATVAPSLDNLRAALRAKLAGERLDRATWIRDASQAAIYRTGQSVTRFLLLVASHNAVPDEDVPGLIVKGRRGVLNLLTRDQWNDDETLTVEHVAPDAAHSAGWPRSVYNDQRTVQRLGNFVLIPAVENNVLADRPWAQKRVLYQVFGASTNRAATAAIETARASGFNAGKRAAELVEESAVLPMCQAISTFEGPWDEEFIARRSVRLAELAWDTIFPWIEPPAPRARPHIRRG